MRNQYTDKQRSELVRLVTSGRATVPDAAARIGVKPSTAYRWMRGAPTAGPARPGPGTAGLLDAPPTFVRVVPSGGIGPALAVRVGGAEIQVGHDFDGDLLRAVVNALGGGAT